MLKALPVKERMIKLVLAVLIIIASIIIFPKNYKISIENYDGRQTNVVLSDAETGDKTEAGYIFGKGCIHKIPLSKGLCKSIVIEDEREYVDEIAAYYGSVKISTDVTVSGEDGNLLVDISYNKSKLVLMIVLYSLLCIAIMGYGIIKILQKEFTHKKEIKLNVSIKEALLFAGMTLLYIIVLYLVSRGQIIKWIYPLEIVFSAAALFLTLCVLKNTSNSFKGTLVAYFPISLVLAMSINKICAFTFIDGHQAIMEQVDIAGDKLRHWEKNSARLNYIIMGTFERFNFIEKLKGETPAKIIHWFFGAILLIYIIWFISDKLLKVDSPKVNCFRFTVVFCSVFLYNNTLCALKNYNYDLFSLTFGVIAFLHLVYAARYSDKKYAMSAVCFATLGTLEKVIDWPVMLLCMMAYVILTSKEDEKKVLRCGIETLKIVGLTLGIAMSCNLYIQHIVRRDYFAYYNLDNLLQPLQGQMYHVINKLSFTNNLSDSARFVAGNIIDWIGVFVGAVCCLFIAKHATKLKSLANVGLRIVTTLVIPMLIYVGVCNYLYYHNGNDYLKKGCFAALSIMKNTYGTVALLLILIAMVAWRINSSHKELIFIMSVTGFYFPMIYVFLEKGNIEGRYFNVYGLITIICALLVLLDRISDEKIMEQCALGMLFFGFSVFEIWPYCPTNLYFMPIWNIEDKGSGDYFGAGTERMLAGERLLKLYSEKGDIPENVVIYINYGGEWNAAPEGWEFRSYPSEGLYSLGDHTIDDIEFGEDVYFAYTAAALRRKRYEFYPEPLGWPTYSEVHIRGIWAVDLYKVDDLKDYFETKVFIEQ